MSAIDARKLAVRVWRESQKYDFSPYQMGADGSLTLLGLAKESRDSRYPGEITIYADRDGRFRDGE